MSGERPGLLPRGRSKRREGWLARIAKAGVSFAVAGGVLLLAWAEVFPCAARRAGLKGIKLPFAEFEAPACADEAQNRDPGGTAVTTTSVTSTTADTPRTSTTSPLKNTT